MYQKYLYDVDFSDILTEFEKLQRSKLYKPNGEAIPAIKKSDTTPFKGKFSGTLSEDYVASVVAPGLYAPTIEVSIEKVPNILISAQPTLRLNVTAKTLEGKDYSYATVFYDLDAYEVDTERARTHQYYKSCDYSAGILNVFIPVKKINNVIYSVKAYKQGLEPDA